MSVALPYSVYYQTISTNSVAAVALGPTGGKKGDTIKSLIVTVSSATGSTVTLLDNTTAYILVADTTPVGVYVINMDIISTKGAWSLKTGTGASVLATGQFS